jgi:hypothetical protein
VLRGFEERFDLIFEDLLQVRTVTNMAGDDLAGAVNQVGAGSAFYLIAIEGRIGFGADRVGHLGGGVFDFLAVGFTGGSQEHKALVAISLV